MLSGGVVLLLSILNVLIYVWKGKSPKWHIMSHVQWPETRNIYRHHGIVKVLKDPPSPGRSSVMARSHCLNCFSPSFCREAAEVTPFAQDASAERKQSVRVIKLTEANVAFQPRRRATAYQKGPRSSKTWAAGEERQSLFFVAWHVNSSK